MCCCFFLCPGALVLFLTSGLLCRAFYSSPRLLRHSFLSYFFLLLLPLMLLLCAAASSCAPVLLSFSSPAVYFAVGPFILRHGFSAIAFFLLVLLLSSKRVLLLHTTFSRRSSQYFPLLECSFLAWSARFPSTL